MIQLNVDYSLLTKFFGISPSKIPQYANKDLEEIMELSDRVAVMFGGKVAGIVEKDDITLDKLGLLMGGITGKEDKS